MAHLNAALSSDDRQAQRAYISGCRIKRALESLRSCTPRQRCQLNQRRPSADRLERSTTEQPFELSKYQDEVGSGSEAAIAKKDTVLYLAYGSNLCYETFQGKRGIKPLAQVNVLVPELRMTFDLPGIPYTEPCFANTARRDPTNEPNVPNTDSEKEESPFLSDNGYHKDRWKKGLVGVVYEVTPTDYAHIIATEGGGSAYQDILVTCYPLSSGANTVPERPTTAPFKAHTLFAPYAQPDPSKRGRFARPDPSYAQASARYLKLISDGGREHAFPQEYQDYLVSLRPYTITTRSQRIGQLAMLTLWAPFVALVFALTEAFQDKKTGRSPAWLMALSNAIFHAVWLSYDGIFKKPFGDGERTIGDDKDVPVHGKREAAFGRKIIEVADLEEQE